MADIEQIKLRNTTYDVRDANAVHQDDLPEGTIDLTLTSTSISDGTTTLDISGKQDTLVSGTNIKTINSTSILGSGNIALLKNGATGTSSFAIPGTSTSNYSTQIGQGADVTIYSTAVGYAASARSRGVAIGSNATATPTYGAAVGYHARAADYAVSVGSYAEATANYAIQLGYGTNSTANTFAVGFGADKEYQLLDIYGKIPVERLSVYVGATENHVPQFTNDGGLKDGLGLITSITSSATDTQLPTAKATYDLVNLMINGAIGGSY